MLLLLQGITRESGAGEAGLMEIFLDDSVEDNAGYCVRFRRGP